MSQSGGFESSVFRHPVTIAPIACGSVVYMSHRVVKPTLYSTRAVGPLDEASADSSNSPPETPSIAGDWHARNAADRILTVWKKNISTALLVHTGARSILDSGALPDTR